MFPTIGRQDWRTGTAGDRVGSAIAQASARTGVDFSYLMRQASIESGLNPTARAKTSSATGLYQFIEQTWLGTVKQHGAAHGLDWAADAIHRGEDGRYRVADPDLRQTILNLRNEPEAASAMAAEFAADNREELESELGRPVEAVDLYLAHFLGAGGAARFLRAHDADPDAPAADLLPKAAGANRWVFFDRGGAPRSLAEIRERFAAKLGGASGPVPRSETPREFAPVRLASLSSAPVTPTGASLQYARLAYMMLAQLGG